MAEEQKQETRPEPPTQLDLDKYRPKGPMNKTKA